MTKTIEERIAEIKQELRLLPKRQWVNFGSEFVSVINELQAEIEKLKLEKQVLQTQIELMNISRKEDGALLLKLLKN